jgi:hypothetical protein
LLPMLESRSSVLDHSAAHRNIQQAAFQVYRFFNCDTGYTNQQLQALLRGVESNTPAARKQFFVHLSSFRRRKIDPLSEKTVVKAFLLPSELRMLSLNNIRNRIHDAVERLEMSMSDAFSAFDANNSGFVSIAELHSALKYLQIGVTEEELRLLVGWMDKDSSGQLDYKEFENLLASVDDEPESGKSLSADALAMKVALSSATASDGKRRKPPPIPSKTKHAIIKDPEVTFAMVSSSECAVLPKGSSDVRVELRGVKKFKLIWSSKGSVVKTPCSVWAMEDPTASGNFLYSAFSSVKKTNKERVFLGHYIVPGYDIKATQEAKMCKYAALYDTSVKARFHSSVLDSENMEKLAPHPSGFRLVLTVPHAKPSKCLYIWKPLVPSVKFVALGVIAIVGSSKPPTRTTMRCVPRQWALPSSANTVHEHQGGSYSLTREETCGLLQVQNAQSTSPPIKLFKVVFGAMARN